MDFMSSAAFNDTAYDIHYWKAWHYFYNIKIYYKYIFIGLAIFL